MSVVILQKFSYLGRLRALPVDAFTITVLLFLKAPLSWRLNAVNRWARRTEVRKRPEPNSDANLRDLLDPADPSYGASTRAITNQLGVERSHPP